MKTKPSLALVGKASKVLTKINITNTMKQHCKRCVGIMHTAKTLHLWFQNKEQIGPMWPDARECVFFFQKLNQPPVFYYQRDKFSFSVLKRSGTLRGICKQKRGTADLCISLTLLAETGRLSNTDGQIYIDKAKMDEKSEWMTDMERQKDGKQVFDQRPESFFTRTSRSTGWQHI